MANTTSFESHKASDWDEKIAFVLIFVPCFVVLFSFAFVGQLIGMRWKSWLPGAENMPNIISGVKASVYTFMSHII
jgi:light-harvesting complex 1 beta chain